MSQVVTSTGPSGSTDLTDQVASAPSSPYKGLSAFSESEQDAQFFFGRDAERDIVTAKLMTCRLSLLYGAGGVGKTSLLEAGVAYHLRQRAGASLKESGSPEFVVVVFKSWSKSPAAALAAQIRRDVVSAYGGRQVLSPPPDGSLTNTLKWADQLDIDLLVILDQFEEFFLYQPAQTDHDSFLEEWVHAVNRNDLNVNFLISIHDTFLCSLDLFKGRIPPPFANSYRLEHLDLEAARAAIVKPIERFDQLFIHDQVPYKIEDSCVDALLEQVQESLFSLDETARDQIRKLRTRSPERPRVETPYLQLVMTRLWEEEQRLGSHVLRRETLDRLGGARKIIATLWQNVLDKLRWGHRPLTAGILRALVTPSGTKIALTLDDLASVVERPVGRVQRVADLLVREKVLRLLEAPLERPELRRYELYHNILARPIVDWCRDQFAFLKFAKRLGGVLVFVLALVAVGLFLMYQFSLSQRDAARSLLSNDPKRSLELGRDSADHWPANYWPTPEAESALRKALSVAQSLMKVAQHKGGVNVASFNEDLDNPLVLTAGADGKARIFQFHSDSEKEQFTKSNEVELPVPEEASSKHPVPILAAAFSPHGRWVVTGYLDGTARLWQSSDGHLIATLRTERTSNPSVPEKYEKAVNTVAFSRDEKFVATGYRDGTARLWRSSDGGLIKTLNGHQGPVNVVVFSPNSKQLVTTSDDRTAILWDVPSGERKLPVLMGRSGPICTAAFSPDGRFVVIGGGSLSKFESREETGKSAPEGIIHVYDSVSGHQEQDLPSHSARVSTVAFSDDGLLMLSASYDRTVRIWNARTWRILNVLRGHTGPIQAAAFSHDGSRVVTASLDETARRWNSTTGECLNVLRGHEGPVYSASFSPDDRQIITASRDGDARIWNSRKFLTLFERVAPKKTAMLSARQEIDQSAPQALKDCHESWLLSVAFSPDEEYVATTSFDCTARIWKVSSGDLVAVLDSVDNPGVQDGHTGPVTAVAFAPDSRRVVTACYDGKARVWEWDDKSRLGRVVAVLLGHSDRVTGATFSRDREGRRIATTGYDNKTRVWEQDPKTGAFSCIATLTGYTARLTPSVFSLDGKRIVTAGKAIATFKKDQTTRGTVKIWDGHSGKLVQPPSLSEFQDRPVTDAVFNSKGTLLAITNIDGKIRVFEMPNGKTVAEFPKDTGRPGHTAYIDRAVFCQDDHRLATDAWDGSVKIWNMATKTLEATLQGITGPYSLLRSSPKCAFILTEYGYCRCMVWDLAGEPIPLAEFRHLEAVSASAISSDGRYAVSAARDGSFLIINLVARPKPEIQAVLRGPRNEIYEGPILDVAFSPDDELLATAGSDGTVKLWNSKTGNLIRQSLTRHNGPVNVVAFRPEVKPVTAGGKYSGLWTVASGGVDGKVQVWTIEKNIAKGRNGSEKLPELELDCGPHPVTMVRFSPDDGFRLLAASREASTAYLWQVTTRKEDRIPLQHGELVSAALFNPQGDLIVTTGGDLTQPPQFASAIAQVWDVQSSKSLLVLKGHEDKPNPDKIVRAAVDLTDLRNLKAQWGINTAEFSPDGKLILTAGDDGTARVWNAKTGELYRVLGKGELERHEESVLWVAFSHDGSKIVTASRDHTAKVWDIGEGKPVAELNGHFGGVSYSEFGPKDKVVLTLSSRDGTARIWDAGTGLTLAILPGDGDGPVVAAAISPKTGQYLIRAHRDGKVLLHRLDISGDLKDLRNSAEKRMNRMNRMEKE